MEKKVWEGGVGVPLLGGCQWEASKRKVFQAPRSRRRPHWSAVRNYSGVSLEKIMFFLSVRRSWLRKTKSWTLSALGKEMKNPEKLKHLFLFHIQETEYEGMEQLGSVHSRRIFIRSLLCEGATKIRFKVVDLMER